MSIELNEIAPQFTYRMVNPDLPKPPLEAIVAECVQPNLYRRWLVAQGDRVIPAGDVLWSWGCYLMEACGLDTFTRLSLRNVDLPPWVQLLTSRVDVTVPYANGEPVAQTLETLDAVLAELGITWHGYP